MAIYLKDPEVDRLARELARLEGASITDVIGQALRERRARLLKAKQIKRRRVREILARIHALPVLDSRDPDTVLYDEDGTPKA